MSLQIGPVVSGAFDRLVSRTGAILLLSYAVLMLAIQSMVNTVFAALYRQAGFDAAVEVLPLVLDIPLGLAAGGVLVASVLSAYLSIVAVRTFVAGTRESFPADALTRNVPLAVLNLFVGGLVYGVLVFAGSLLLLVPGLFLYVALVFMVPYVAVEDRNFVAALRRSYALTAGNRIALFGLLVLLVAVGAVFGGMVGFGASLLLPAALAQLAITLVQAPVSLVSLAVISVAFRQLRDAETGDSRPGTPDDSGTAAAL
ncbi:hypothetical protein [Haloarcula pelagica]|uniref:hypothetical protein n=1 Tax=Haloarcula pelagica TaxID=3033389 RepID=UPI0024C3B92F|nr:hypothetical protein [Halomicroarcula sp. YJ-61-S]